MKLGMGDNKKYIKGLCIGYMRPEIGTLVMFSVY